jgi:hypothetical protein
MILNPEKPDFVETTTTFDEEPPAYDATQSTNYTPAPEKGRQSPSSPSTSGSIIRNASTSTPSPGSSSFKSPSSWFSFGAMSRTDREVKATVIGLVRSLLDPYFLHPHDYYSGQRCREPAIICLERVNVCQRIPFRLTLCNTDDFSRASVAFKAALKHVALETLHLKR